MQTLFYAVYDVPNYLLELFSGHYKFYAAAAAVLFFIVLFFSGKAVTVLRDIFVLASVALGVIAYFKRKFPLVWICVFALILLAIVRLVIYIIISIRDTKRARRIERKAIERGERHRGTLREKRGNSEKEPDSPETEKPERKLQTGSAGNAAAEAARSPENPPAADESAPSGPVFTREQALSAAHKLRDLKDLGIVTDEEFELIKARLYSRLG